MGVMTVPHVHGVPLSPRGVLPETAVNVEANRLWSIGCSSSAKPHDKKLSGLLTYKHAYFTVALPPSPLRLWCKLEIYKYAPMYTYRHYLIDDRSPRCMFDYRIHHDQYITHFTLGYVYIQYITRIQKQIGISIGTLYIYIYILVARVSLSPDI